MDCPICDARMVGAWRSKELQFAACTSCGFVGIDLETWQSPYNGRDYYVENNMPSTDPERSFIRHRVERIVRYRSSGRCTELGSGLGEMALALATAGFAVDAVEESPVAVSYLKERYHEVNWHCSNIIDFVSSCDDEAYDVATLYHVLEHVPPPKRICKDLSRILSKGGLLVVEVPNVAGLHARLKKERWWYFLPHHVNYFTSTTLGRLLDPLGFDLLQVEGKYHFSYPQGVLWKDVLKYSLARLGFSDVICTYWRRR